MRLTESWLREWVTVKASFADIAQALVAGGFEIEAVGEVGPTPAHVVVGVITAMTPHPDAERLHICTVTAHGPARTIVCGAANARVGLRAPLALPGACIGDRTIAVTSVRGVRSEGMLCSAAELGVSGAPGLWELPKDAPAGLPLADYVGRERFLEVAITPNRGDCLCVRGLAREVAALAGGRMRPVPRPSSRRVSAAPPAPIVRVRDEARCQRYCVRTITGLDRGAKTPFWLAERLRFHGLRSHHPIIDVTNYVMLDIGQPLHAFDADQVSGAIDVRVAAAGEEIVLLDGSVRSLVAGDLVIADDQGPLALAGIMGGQRAMVSASTHRIVLEAGAFDAQTVSRTARRLALTTEAAIRFERGVDPALPLIALEHATTLLRRIARGTCGAITDSGTRKADGAGAPIPLRLARIAALLGIRVPKAEVRRYLRALQMTVTPVRDGFAVVPPTFRTDIRIEVDLIEEVARLFGYARIPEVDLAPLAAMAPPPPSPRRLATVLIDRDYHEIQTFSLVDPADHEALGLGPGIPIRNPLAAPWACLRRGLLPGLLRAAQYNYHRQQTRVRLFELGRCYEYAAEGVRESLRLGGVVLGSRLPEQWGAPTTAADFFDVKGDMAAVLALVGVECVLTARAEPWLQVGQSAVIQVGDHPVGYLGALHPRARARWGFELPVFVFEVAADLTHPPRTARQEPPRFPAVRRDLAVVVDHQVAAADVLRSVRATAGELLVELVLFDVYQGKGLDLGKKSLAMGLTLQDFSRTLNDEVVEDIMARTVSALEAGYGARLRQR
ncbi:MAG: phenylalanine--tRNA ligase subunit beta [Acidiferrobacter sp.]